MVLLIATGCDTGDGDELSRPAKVYIAAVRSIAAGIPTEEPDELPVVYIVASGDEPIAAVVQAEVASTLDKEADVRFADHRQEALDADQPHEPVRDGGRLVAVGPVDEEDAPGGTVELPIEIYRSAEEWSRGVVTVARSGDAWSVTSTSLQEIGTEGAGDGGGGDGSGSATSVSSVPASSTASG